MPTTITDKNNWNIFFGDCPSLAPGTYIHYQSAKYQVVHVEIDLDNNTQKATAILSHE